MKQNTISEVAVEVRRATPQDYLHVLEAVLAYYVVATSEEYCVDAPAACRRQLGWCGASRPASLWFFGGGAKRKDRENESRKEERRASTVQQRYQD